MLLNLLPWREHARRKKQRYYCCSSGIIMLIFTLLCHAQYQQYYHQLLLYREQTAIQDNNLLSLKKIIAVAHKKNHEEALQKNKIFLNKTLYDTLIALATTLPANTVLQTIEYHRSLLTVVGITNTMANIKTYQHALELLPSVASVSLTDIIQPKTNVYQFSLKIPWKIHVIT
jgi:Tfp pilus assembly protein PilN